MGNKVSDPEKHNVLQPYISGLGAWALAVGTSIGWGSLVVTNSDYLANAGPAGSVIGMLVGALIMLIIGTVLIFTVGITICFAFAMFSSKSGTALFDPAFMPDAGAVRQVVVIAFITPWAFVGFESITHSSEEFTFEMKKLRRILVSAIFVTTLLYGFVSAATLRQARNRQNGLQTVFSAAGLVLMVVFAISNLICGVFKHSPVFRTGGDEFVVLMNGSDYPEREALVAEFNRKVEENFSSRAWGRQRATDPCRMIFRKNKERNT